LSGAGIVFVDRRRVIDEARLLARRMRAAHPELARIWLVGSFARGGAGPRSDLDLVAVVADTECPPRDRAARYAPVHPRAVDLTVYTQAELDGFGAKPPSLLRAALEHGIDLLAPDGGAGKEGGTSTGT
jgi:predicted nucleotidyltransferase